MPDIDEIIAKVKERDKGNTFPSDGLGWEHRDTVLVAEVERLRQELQDEKFGKAVASVATIREIAEEAGDNAVRQQELEEMVAQRDAQLKTLRENANDDESTIKRLRTNIQELDEAHTDALAEVMTERDQEHDRAIAAAAQTSLRDVTIDRLRERVEWWESRFERNPPQMLIDFRDILGVKETSK